MANEAALFWVRQATNADSGAIVRLVAEVYDEYGFGWDAEGYHADLYDIEAAYWRKGHGFWVAESLEDSSILGTVGLHLYDRLRVGDEPTVQHEGYVRIAGSDCSLERMYVARVSRGIGVGAAMFEHVCAVARERGKRLMEIWSDKKLETAHGFYQRFGAEIVGERLCHDPEQSPEWGMRFILRAEPLASNDGPHD